MMHRAWSSIVEVPYCFSRSYVKFQGHTALKIVEFYPNWAFLVSNSSLNSPMAMKCCTKLETAKERCPIVFQGHPSNFKVTRDKTSPILTQIGRFRTIGRSQLSNPSDLPCYSWPSISVFPSLPWYLLDLNSLAPGRCVIVSWGRVAVFNDKSSQWVPSLFCATFFIINPISTKLKGGILVSPCPSVHLWTESCLLCIFNNIHRIHFLFAHLIKQLQKMCHVFQNSTIWNCGKFFKFVTLTLSSFDLGWIQYDSIVWVIMRRWGVLRTQAF